MNEFISEIKAYNSWEKQMTNFGFAGVRGLALRGGLAVGFVVSNPVEWVLPAVVAVAWAVLGMTRFVEGLQKRERMEMVKEGACPIFFVSPLI